MSDADLVLKFCLYFEFMVCAKVIGDLKEPVVCCGFSVVVMLSLSMEGLLSMSTF